MVLKKKFVLLSIAACLLTGCDSRGILRRADGFVFYGESTDVCLQTKSPTIPDSYEYTELAKITNEKIIFIDDGEQYVAYAKVKIIPSIQDFLLEKSKFFSGLTIPMATPATTGRVPAFQRAGRKNRMMKRTLLLMVLISSKRS